MELVDEEQGEYLESMEQNGTAQTLLTGQDGPPPLVEIASRTTSPSASEPLRLGPHGRPAEDTGEAGWLGWNSPTRRDAPSRTAKHCVNTYRDGNSSSTRQPSTKRDFPVWREDSCTQTELSCPTRGCRIFELALSGPLTRRPLDTLCLSWFARGFALPPSSPLLHRHLERPVGEEALADVDRLDLTEEEALVLFGAPSKTWSTKRDETREQRKDRQLFRSIDDDGGQRFRSRG